ncbi:MAG: D-sedoheptulose-7-phosphate isomerase [Candidatus Muiribacteriota bacterium]
MSFKSKTQKFKEKIDRLSDISDSIERVTEIIKQAFISGNKIIIFGNGGSASDALHFSAELQGRFFLNRKSLPAVCLNSNVSTITAVANDFGYEDIFYKPLEGILSEGDIVFGISTSGNSANILKAMEFARQNGGITVGLTGENRAKLKNNCKYIIEAPSQNTPEIQEMHIMIIHYICEMVEKELFSG